MQFQMDHIPSDEYSYANRGSRSAVDVRAERQMAECSLVGNSAYVNPMDRVSMISLNTTLAFKDACVPIHADGLPNLPVSGCWLCAV